MASSSQRIECPDCGRKILKRNIRNHYRRLHPELDPYERLREAEKASRRPIMIPFDVKTSPVVAILGTLLVAILLVVGGLVILSMVSVNSEPPKPRDIFYAASDGAVINATYYPSHEADRPTVFLIHDIGKDRTQWEDFAIVLRDKGYNVLAPDLRGHGESINSLESGVVYDWREMSNEDFTDISRDIEAGSKWIRGTGEDGEKNTEASGQAALIGVGRGGQFALVQAGRMSRQNKETLQFVSACLISPTMDSMGLDIGQTVEDWGDVRPIMFAGSEDDGSAVKAIDELMERRPENGVEVIVGGGEQGISLIEREPIRKEIFKTLVKGFSD